MVTRTAFGVSVSLLASNVSGRTWAVLSGVPFVAGSRVVPIGVSRETMNQATSHGCRQRTVRLFLHSVRNARRRSHTAKNKPRVRSERKETPPGREVWRVTVWRRNNGFPMFHVKHWVMRDLASEFHLGRMLMRYSGYSSADEPMGAHDLFWLDSIRQVVVRRRAAC
jgi:hypothetical protein